MNNIIEQTNTKSENSDLVCVNNIPKLPSSLVLNTQKISSDKTISYYWNNLCENIQPTLWLPKQNINNKNDFNFQEASSNFWKKVITPKIPFNQEGISNLKTPKIIAITDNAIVEDIKVVTTKKIRIYPQNLKAYEEALILHRRAYNLAMSHYINDTYKDEEGKLKNLRPEIRDITKKECEENKTIYSSNIVDNAVLHAKQTFNSVCDKNKKNKGNKSCFSKLKYKSKKGTTHSFKIDRLPLSGYPYSTILGKAHITEKIPQEAYDKTCVITCDKKRWYINVQQHTIIKSEIQGQVKCVSVDQGVRTFATTYSPNEVAFIGEDFAKTKLFPLMKEVDKLISQKQKLLNQFKNVKFKDLPQWTRDRVVCIEKQINELKCKKEDLIYDLHHKFANYLLTNFDCIFLPHFETKGMVKREGKVRTIRRNTARQMLDLGHYKFKLLLKWLAKKYGKKVIDCNESNTSKTRSWNGTIDEKLGSKKIIKDEYIVVHRDVNGARGIYLKCVTTVA